MKFHYSYYWKTWSRVIHSDRQGIVELNLTPVNPSPRTWAREAEEVFRVHFTARGEKDILTDTLPDNVMADLRKHYSDELIDRMLNHDYFTEVSLDDIHKSNRQCNGGGVPLQAIKDIRDGKKTFHYNS